MKTSFLRNFFNSKDLGCKNNFDIHNVDLDDSDDVVCNESFFERNNSPNETITKSVINKSDEMFYKKKFNIYSFNDSMSSNEAKSPIISKEFNFSKLKRSPLNINFDNSKNIKNKSNLDLTTTNTFNVMKTPTKDSKLTQFDLSKSSYKNLCSPTITGKELMDKNGKFQNLIKLQQSPIRKFPDGDKAKNSFDKNMFNECNMNVDNPKMKRNSIDKNPKLFGKLSNDLNISKDYDSKNDSYKCNKRFSSPTVNPNAVYDGKNSDEKDQKSQNNFKLQNSSGQFLECDQMSNNFDTKLFNEDNDDYLKDLSLNKENMYNENEGFYEKLDNDQNNHSEYDNNYSTSRPKSLDEDCVITEKSGDFSGRIDEPCNDSDDAKYFGL